MPVPSLRSCITGLAAAVVLAFEVPEVIQDPTRAGQWLYVLAGVLLVVWSVVDLARRRG